MATRIVEWKKPYTWGKAITIDENKVISLNLRGENNLIIYDEWDDEIYVDLQLPDWRTPQDTFPVWITTGRVSSENWDVTWTIIIAKTTSGDTIKILYGDDWTLWMDNDTWTFKQIYFKGDVDTIIEQLRNYIDSKPTFKPFLEDFVTNSTTQDFLDSVLDSDIQEWDVYLGRVTCSDLPSSMVQAEIEVYVYPENWWEYVLFCVLRSATTSPYIWQCSSYQYDGWHAIWWGGGWGSYTAWNGIDITNNVISNILPWATVSSSQPANPSQWDQWYDTATDKLYTYDGSQWNEIWSWSWWWDVVISQDANNTLTTWAWLWAGTEANYQNIQNPNANTLYFTF